MLGPPFQMLLCARGLCRVSGGPQLARPLDRLSPTELVATLSQIRDAIQRLADAPDSLAPWHSELNRDSHVRGTEAVLNTGRRNLQDLQSLEYLATRAPQLALVSFGVAIVEMVRNEFAAGLWIVLIGLLLVVVAPLTQMALEILDAQLNSAYLLRAALVGATGVERDALERKAEEMIRKRLHIPLR